MNFSGIEVSNVLTQGKVYLHSKFQPNEIYEVLTIIPTYLQTFAKVVSHENL